LAKKQICAHLLSTLGSIRAAIVFKLFDITVFTKSEITTVLSVVCCIEHYFRSSEMSRNILFVDRLPKKLTKTHIRLILPCATLYPLQKLVLCPICRIKKRFSDPLSRRGYSYYLTLTARQIVISDLVFINNSLHRKFLPPPTTIPHKQTTHFCHA
jgi:hypothetical protein